MSDNYIKGFIQAPIANHLKTFLQERCAGLTAENVSSELPTLLKLSAVVSGKDINEIVGNSTTGVLDSIVSELTDPIVHVIGIIVSFIIVYIVARIIFTLLVLLIDVIVSKGPLGIINKALGFVFGLAFSVIIAWVLVAVSEFAMGFVGYKFDAGAVYEFLNGFNPLDLLLSF